jgi:hypothetical protein
MALTTAYLLAALLSSLFAAHPGGLGWLGVDDTRRGVSVSA